MTNKEIDELLDEFGSHIIRLEDKPVELSLDIMKSFNAGIALGMILIEQKRKGEAKI